ncbi:hypothetical protein GON09_001507 [Rhodococcus sp. B50]|nr:hypothetical protein [Rhodococcus sp. B50]
MIGTSRVPDGGVDRQYAVQLFSTGYGYGLDAVLGWGPLSVARAPAAFADPSTEEEPPS